MSAMQRPGAKRVDTETEGQGAAINPTEPPQKVDAGGLFSNPLDGTALRPVGSGAFLLLGAAVVGGLILFRRKKKRRRN